MKVQGTEEWQIKGNDHRLSKPVNSTGGMNTILLEDIPSFGVLAMAVESTV